MFRYLCIFILLIELLAMIIITKNEPMDDDGGLAVGFIIMLLAIALPLLYIIFH